MSQQELVKKIIGVLEEIHIPYMLTGSMVSSLQGEPRSTHDIDIIIQIFQRDVSAFLSSFSTSEYYIEEKAIQSAINEGSMFNVINVREGDKVDFWILTDTPFDKSRFARRKEVLLFGVKTFISSPEDTIAAKLHWAKLSGGSEKHFTDALRVYEVQYNALD